MAGVAAGAAAAGLAPKEKGVLEVAGVDAVAPKLNAGGAAAGLAPKEKPDVLVVVAPPNENGDADAGAAAAAAAASLLGSAVLAPSGDDVPKPKPADMLRAFAGELKEKPAGPAPLAPVLPTENVDEGDALKRNGVGEDV